MANTNNSSVSFADIVNMFVSNVGNMPGEKGMPDSVSNLVSKNIITGEGSTLNRAKRVNPILTSNESTRTYNIGTIFAKALYDFNIKRKTDKKESSIVSQAKSKITPVSPPTPQQKNDKSSLLGFLTTLFGGVAALIVGLLTDGPFKGTLKIAAKALIGILTKQLKQMFNMGKAAIKGFIPDNFIGKAITNSINSIKVLFKSNITSSFKTLSAGTGFIPKIIKFLKPLGPLLKKVPVIGNLISIGFAISRFMSGDNVGGVIDILSALTGLLYLLPPVGPAIAFPLSLGLDMLNAFLDVKTSGAENKNKAKLDILGDMAKSIGSFIWKNALWIPVIGGFKRIQMAGEAFKNGNIIEGLQQFGKSLLSFGGLSSIVTGIEMLLGFGKNEESDRSLSPKSGWYSGLKTWIKKKLKDLPYVLRKPLEWFGILDETSGETTNIDNNNTPKNLGDNLNSFFTSIWDSLKNAFSNINLGDNLKNLFTSIWDNFKNGLLNIKDSLSRSIKISVQEATKLIDSVNNLLYYGDIRDLNEQVNRGRGLENLRAGIYEKTRNGEDIDSNISKLNLSINKDINIQKLLVSNNKKLEDQTNLIKLQNELLVQLVVTSKEQLNVSKKAKPSVAVVDSGSNTSNVSMNNAFSTSRPDGRSMYMSSPYSISPSFA